MTIKDLNAVDSNQESQSDNQEPQPYVKPKLDKSTKLTLKLGFGVLLFGFIYLFAISGSDEDSQETVKVEGGLTRGIKTNSEGVSETHKQKVLEYDDAMQSEATAKGESFVTQVKTSDTSTYFEDEQEHKGDSSLFGEEQEINTAGAGVSLDKPDDSNPLFESNESNKSNEAEYGDAATPDEDAVKYYPNATSNTNASRNSRRNAVRGGGANSQSGNRISQLTEKYKTINIAHSSVEQEVKNNEEDEYNKETSNSTRRFLDDDDVASLNENNTGSVREQGRQIRTSITASKNGGRGLFVGEKIIGEFEQGLNSNTEAEMILVKVIQGPLKGARIIFKPTLVYDNYLFQSSTIMYKNYQAPFSSVIVTPNANLDLGYTSDVNYHTIYKLAVAFTWGVMTGATEYISKIGTTTYNGDNTDVTREFDQKEMWWSAAGGVAQATTDMVQKEIATPPTVKVKGGDVVGIMMTENWNSEWAPRINHNTKGVY